MNPSSEQVSSLPFPHLASKPTAAGRPPAWVACSVPQNEQVPPVLPAVQGCATAVMSVVIIYQIPCAKVARLQNANLVSGQR